MKTLLFTLEYPPFKGGVANYYGNICKYWSEFEAAVLDVDQADPEAQLRVLHNNDGALLSKWLYPKWLPAMKQLSAAVKRQNIEHIIVGHILPLGTVAYRHYKKTGVPYTVILHGMDLALAMRPGRKQMISKIILQNAHSIICGNSYTADMALGFIGSDYDELIHVVHPGVNPDFHPKKELVESLRKEYNLNNKTVLLSFGRLVDRKGFLDVVAAMPKVTAKFPDLHLFIAGEGPLKTELVEASMKNKNISFLGKTSFEERDAWLALCDMYIMPSYSKGADFEGFGIVYLEANIAGKPVIGGRSGGVPEAIDDGISGMLVEPRNIDDIAKAIIKLAENPGLRRQMGEQGHTRAVEWFNWEKQVARIYKIINN